MLTLFLNVNCHVIDRLDTSRHYARLGVFFLSVNHSSASTSLQQPHHLCINKSSTITSHHCCSKPYPNLQQPLLYLNPYLQAMPICISPLVYVFALWSLTFVKAIY
jgi:hypothetical protein